MNKGRATRTERDVVYDFLVKIRRLQRDTEISSTSIAATLGVSVPRVSQLLGDSHHNMTLRTIVRLAGVFGLEPVVELRPTRRAAGEK